MQRKNYLFWDYEQLQNLTNTGELSADRSYLICIHTAAHSKDEAAKLIEKVHELFPCSQIAGTSAGDIIYMGKLYNDKCLISFIDTGDVRVTVKKHCYDGITPSCLAEKVFTESCTCETAAMLMFFSDLYPEAPEFIDEFTSVSGDIKITGGMAGDISRLGQSNYAFTTDGMADRSVICVSFDSRDVTAELFSITGHEPIGDFYTFTKTHGCIIDEIDGTRAADWFRELTGKTELHEYNNRDMNAKEDILLQFPIEAENHHGASRYVKYLQASDEISQYHINCHENDRFRVTFMSAMTSANQCADVCSRFEETCVDISFCYSCTLRRIWISNYAEIELRPFEKASLCGALLYGEIGVSDGFIEYLNGSCNILTLARSNRHISINNDALNELMHLRDENEAMCNYVLKRQNQHMYKKNIALMQKIELQENKVNEKIFKDSITGMSNINRFHYDSKTRSFECGCLVMLEKGDVALNHFNAEEYREILTTDINCMRSYLSENFSHLCCRVYIFDECSFLITSDVKMSDCDFLNAAEALYAHYGTVNVEKYSYSCINHFVIVANQKNMLEKIKLLKANSNDKLDKPERFIVYDSSQGIEHAVEESLKMVMIINYAIENDGVIPYFQPIYDNSTGKIDKYEALMRLRDPDGKIYYPGQFLSIAKEYRLYLQISQIMINKVFDLFENRTETVSINLSAYDINSPEIRGMIYERLERIGNADRFIFEVLESEEFRELDVLKHFIAKVRRHNVRIAIDDFGAGFTNLLEIAQLSPNYIKIDGQIVREVMNSELHRKIIGTILYLANSLDIDLIAEYIENEALQQYASEQGVRYSQGYYFSKAVPYDELNKSDSIKQMSDATM